MNCPQCGSPEWRQDKEGPAEFFCAECGHEDYETKYRLVAEGEVLEAGDEGLLQTCLDWRPLTSSDIIVGLKYAPGFHMPMRRKIQNP